MSISTIRNKKLFNRPPSNNKPSPLAESFSPLLIFRPGVYNRNLLQRNPEVTRGGTGSDFFVVNEYGPAAQFGDVNGSNYYSFPNAGTDSRVSATFVWVGQYIADNGTILRDSTVGAGFIPIFRSGTGFGLRWNGVTFGVVGTWDVARTIVYVLTVQNDGTNVILKRFANGELLATDTTPIGGSIAGDWQFHRAGVLAQGGNNVSNLLAYFDKPFDDQTAINVSRNPWFIFGYDTLHIKASQPASVIPTIFAMVPTNITTSTLRPRYQLTF